jgi:AhpD family alkylhydroperoxidase
MKNPALVVPDAMQHLVSLGESVKKGGVPLQTLGLVVLRASQINGCSFCVDMHARELKQAGASDQKIFAVSAWRDSPEFTNSERAALALAEAETRLADRPDPVPDEIWKEAAQHYDEKALASLVMAIGLINVFNRINVTTRQVAGAAHR